jgi:hypothetical protein
MWTFIAAQDRLVSGLVQSKALHTVSQDTQAFNYLPEPLCLRIRPTPYAGVRSSPYLPVLVQAANAHAQFEPSTHSPTGSLAGPRAVARVPLSSKGRAAGPVSVGDRRSALVRVSFEYAGTRQTRSVGTAAGVAATPRALPLLVKYRPIMIDPMMPNPVATRGRIWLQL